MRKNLKNDIEMASRLIALSASMNLHESGTPTTALPPSTNATRQMSKDIATTGKEGIPTPVGAEPSEDNGETSQGTLDVNGEDAPADVKANYAKNGKTVGMDIPADVKPNLPGPASATTAPGTNDTAGAAAEMAKAKQKSGTGLRVESMSAEEIMDALVEHFGGTDELMFALVADNMSFELAEALIEGTIDLDRVEEGLRKFAQPILGEAVEDEITEGEELLACLEGEHIAALINHLIDEGFGDVVKKGIDTVKAKFGINKTAKPNPTGKPSPGYLASKQRHLDRKRGTSGSVKIDTSSTSDKPTSAWSATKRGTAGARPNNR